MTYQQAAYEHRAERRISQKVTNYSVDSRASKGLKHIIEGNRIQKAFSQLVFFWDEFGVRLRALRV